MKSFAHERQHPLLHVAGVAYSCKELAECRMEVLKKWGKTEF